MKKKLISILIPFFNEEGALKPLVNELKEIEKLISSKYDFEIILLDNHSSDKSQQESQDISTKYKNIKLIRHSRNFGYQANIFSGYNLCKGDAAIQLDADGEDDPKMILKFIEKWEQGYEVVYGIRKSRKENLITKLFRNIFYRILHHIAEINIPVDAGDFRLIDKKIIQILNKFEEKNIYLRGLISYIGFNQIGIDYDRRKRKIGKSKFSLFSYFKLASIGIISFSKKPLIIIFFTGIFIFGFSFLLLLYYLFQYFIGSILVQGFVTLIVVLLLFFGTTFLFMGIIALYIGQIHDEVKKRPIYISEKNNEEK